MIAESNEIEHSLLDECTQIVSGFFQEKIVWP